MTRFSRWLQELDSSTVHSPYSSSEARDKEISTKGRQSPRVEKKSSKNWIERLMEKSS